LKAEEEKYETPKAYKVERGRDAYTSYVTKDGDVIAELRKMSNGYKYKLSGESQWSHTYPTRKEALGWVATKRNQRYGPRPQGPDLIDRLPRRPAPPT
jgi:hypothetical protein